MLLKVGVGIVAIVAGYDRWNRNIRLAEFPVASFPQEPRENPEFSKSLTSWRTFLGSATTYPKGDFSQDRKRPTTAITFGFT